MCMDPNLLMSPAVHILPHSGSRSGTAFTRTQSSNRSNENLAALDLPEFGWRSATDMQREDEAKSEKVGVQAGKCYGGTL